jgi:predicted SnoaL-like aldol condensation-catalyzing enzyme
MTALAYVAPTQEQLEDAERLVARFAEKWVQPEADNLRDLMAPDTSNHVPGMAGPGDREAVVEHFRGVLKMLPDLHLEIVRWAPTGDAVMIEWKAYATVAGTPLSWTGVDRFNIRGDVMYDGRVYWDSRALAERMAAAVAAAHAATQ